MKEFIKVDPDWLENALAERNRVIALVGSLSKALITVLEKTKPRPRGRPPRKPHD